MPANFKPSKLSSWVLLPDLVFGLRSRNTDLGSVCVTLPMSSHHLPRDLSQQVSKALRTVRVLESERHESHVKHKSCWPEIWCFFGEKNIFIFREDVFWDVSGVRHHLASWLSLYF